MKLIQRYRQILTRRSSLLLDCISYLFVFCFSAAGVIVSVNQYWQYDDFYYDFGIFDRAIWEVSRFQAPIIDHLVVAGKWIFADHFSPSLFLLSPFFWIFPQHETLLVLQALIVGLSALVLYRLAVFVLQDRFIALSIVTAYGLFIGLQNAIITDFHEITVMTLPLMLCFYALAKKKSWLYWLSLIITLGCKENMFLIGIGISIVMFFLQPSWRKYAVITFILSIVYGGVAILYVIPYFSGGIYQYAPGSLTFSSITQHLLDIDMKRRTAWYTLLSFGFLPLFSPAFWFLILQDFITRFVPEWPTRWGLGLHYSAPLAVILSVATIYSYRLFYRLKRPLILHILAVVLLINAIILYRFILHGPLALAYNPAFYKHSQDFGFLNNMVAVVPDNASVMAQNNIVSHFTHQTSWILLSTYEKDKPDYIVIDNRAAQSPNDFFSTDISPTVILTSLLNDKHYKVAYHVHDQYVFKRI